MKDSIKNKIIQSATKSHQKYPQYKNHWDGPEWKLAIANKTITTKMGLAIEKGDYTIAKLELDEDDHKWKVVFYSLLNRCDTLTSFKNIKFIENIF